jgi:hypothetical protein
MTYDFMEAFADTDYKATQSRVSDFQRYGPNAEFTKSTLAQVAQAAGLPADFDWTPFLDQAAQQHQAQFGEPYNNRYTNYAHPAAAAVQFASAANPQLAPFVSQVGEGSAVWNQGNQMRDQALHTATSNSDWQGLASVFAGPALAGAAGALGGAGAAGGTAAPAATGLGNAGIEAAMLGGPAATAGMSAGVGGGLSAAGTIANAGGIGGTTAATQGSALGRLLGLGQQGEDWLSVGGSVLPSIFSAIGSNQAANKYEDLANQYKAMGEPYRNQLANISNDPNAFFQGQPAQLATDAVLRKLSAGGNPAANPYSQAQAINALWGEYGKERDRLAGFGGLTQYNAAAPGAASNAVGASQTPWADIGYGVGQVFNPQKKTLADLLKSYQV